jgi:DsbC/DsbD-like thiol-disulfide interchange protein
MENKMGKIIPSQEIFQREAQSLRRIVQEREPSYQKEVAFGLALVVKTEKGHKVYVNFPGEQGISATLTSSF